MKRKLRVLIVEDSEDDTLLVLHHLRKCGYHADYERVDTAEKMKLVLEKNWDIVLSDYNMPHFTGLDALKILNEKGIDIPFIIISGTIGEDTAVEAMKAGAQDYMMKNNLHRLLPAIEREIHESHIRAEKVLLEKKQKQTEILKESEEKFRNLVSDMPVGVLLRGSQGEVLMCNGHAIELLGLTEEQLLGKDSFDPGWNAIHEDGTPFPEYTFPGHQAIAEHRPIRGVVMGIYRPEKGGRVWLLVDAIPQINDEGSIKHVVSTFIDITGRKIALEALQESEALHRSILLASPDNITISDLNGRILTVSQSALKMFGWENETELVGHNIFEFLVQEDMERAMHNISLMFQGILTGPSEYRAIRKDGSTFDIEANAEFILNSDGTPGKIVIIIRDITQRKQTEAKVIKLTKAVEQSPVAIVITNRKGIIEYANPFCTQNTGYRNDEIVGHNPSIFKSGLTTVEAYRQLWDTISTGNIWRGEICNKKKNGDLYWERASISPVKNSEGNITNYIGIKEDITAQRKALEALKESEEKHRILFLDSPDAYLILEGGIFVDCNHATEVMFGGNRFQIIGQPPETISPEFQSDGRKSSEVAVEKIQKALDTGMITFEWIHRRFDGTNFFAEVSLARIELDGKQAFFTTCRDISQRKKAEQALRESQQFLTEVIENNGALIYAKNREGCYELVNRKWEETTGLKREFTIGKTDEELFPGVVGEEFRKIDIAVLESGKVIESEEVLEDAMGKRVFLSIKLPLRDQNNLIKGICGMSTEITERLRASEEIRLKNEELHKLNVEKDKFFSIIAHDLRSPFIGLLGLSDLMAEEFPDLSADEIRKYSLSIRDSATKIYSLLENLLEWAQFQRGIIPFEPKLILLLPVVEKCLASIRENVQSKEIEITSDIPDHLKVLADNNMIQVVIRNLATNALKFTPRGGKIMFSARLKTDRSIEISIKDTGIGMNSKMVDDLFRLDVRTNRPGTEGEPSSGLGLILCKDFIEKHSGKIWVESEEGKGTTFMFTLPYN